MAGAQWRLSKYLLSRYKKEDEPCPCLSLLIVRFCCSGQSALLSVHPKAQASLSSQGRDRAWSSARDWGSHRLPGQPSSPRLLPTVCLPCSISGSSHYICIHQKPSLGLLISGHCVCCHLPPVPSHTSEIRLCPVAWTCPWPVMAITHKLPAVHPEAHLFMSQGTNYQFKSILNSCFLRYLQCLALPRWLSSKEFTCQCRRHRRHGFNPWVRKIP